MFKRFGLFVALNLAVVVMISIVFTVFGLDHRAGLGQNLQLGPVLVSSMIIGFVGAFVSLLLSKPMAKWSVGAKPLEPTHWVYQTVATQAERAGIRTPEVCVYTSDEPNAFATGAFKNSSMVAVSTGLLNSLTQDEVKAVLGHEVGHIANGDMVTMTLLQGVVNTFVVFAARIVGWFVDRVILKNESDAPGMGFYATNIVLQVVLGIGASLILAWYSRRREFVADRAGADLTSNRSMANALRRLGGEAPSQLSGNLQAFGIRGGGGWMAAFSTHPPIEERVAALERRV